MISQIVLVKNKLGLHARPAASFSKEALKFECEILVTKGTKTCNAKSILGLLSACIKCGDQIKISCNGIDEDMAIESLVNLLHEED